jgi:hypothetical protein
MERVVARVDDVVSCSRRHDDGIVTLDHRTVTVDPDLALPFFDTEELVAIVVRLLTYLLARLDGHQHELQVLARVQHATEICIFLGQLFDVAQEALYGLQFRFSGRYDLPLDFTHDLKLHYQELFKDQP